MLIVPRLVLGFYYWAGIVALGMNTHYNEYEPPRSLEVYEDVKKGAGGLLSNGS